MKITPTTLRFFIWFLLTIICFAGLIKIFSAGLSLNTNVLDLLPVSHKNPSAEKAISRFSNRMGRQIVFLIGNQDKERAQKAADRFYRILKQSDLFEQFNYRVDANEQQAWGRFYFPYRLSLLTAEQKKLLQSDNIAQIKNSARFALYSPMGIAGSELLQNDPYFLFQNYLMSLPKPASRMELYHQRMMAQQGSTWYVMLNAQIKQNSFDIAAQNKIAHIIQNGKAAVLKNFPKSKFLMNGMLFYAKAGADEAQRNISTIGMGSLIGIILLVLFTFRSLSPLLLTLLSGLIGFIAAFVITQYIFGSVYLFTLVFGAGLIGIVVDYAFFYYADQLLGGKKWNAAQGLKNILPGISLGLLNIVLAYLILSLSPFPGLRQLAVFAVSGLVMAYLTVICVFPLILKSKKTTFQPALLRFTNRYLEGWQKISVKKIILLFVPILILSGIGIYRLKPNDDIRALQSMPLSLRQNEKQVKKIIGSDIGLSFYLVEGSTLNKLLDRENILIHQLDRRFPTLVNKYVAINSYLPSVSEQRENYQLVKTKLINDGLASYLKKIGVKKQNAISIERHLEAIRFKPLTLDDWLNSPVSKSLRFLFLGKIDRRFATVVLLSDKLNTQTLQMIAKGLPNVAYVNKADEISRVFKIYREKISILLVMIYIVLFVLLTLRYKLKKAFFCFMPPFTACALSLGVLDLFGVPLTLFNLLAIILILGIGVDYVLFFAETRSNYKSTMLAVTLSAIITILSFGLLALSATPAIHYFGLTVLIGITSAFALSPLAAVKK